MYGAYMWNAEPDAPASVVVSRTLRNRIDRNAQMLGVSLKVLKAQVLTRYTEWEQFSREIGFASVTRAFLRSVLKSVDNKTVSTIAGNVIQHQLSYKWSMYFSTVVASILSELGYHTKDLAMHSESPSFMIANFNEVVGVQENGNLK